MKSPRNDVPALISGMSEARFGGYLYEPIPCDLDNEVRALVQAYRASDRDERASLEGSLGREPIDILESFAERQAVLAVRSQSEEPLRLGLTALGMSSGQGDKAQAVMALAKLDHSARLLGADLADVAAAVVEVLPDEARYAIARFLARGDRDGSLLTKLGFTAYGSGPAFVYDNAVPGAASAPASTATPPPVSKEPGGSFVARQRYTSAIPGDAMAIRVKDGALVVTDERARRFVFPLTGADAPGAVVRAFQGTHRWWVVIDRQGRAMVSGPDDDWSSDAFAGVAHAAGIPFDRDALAPGYALPAPRPDHVDLSPSGRKGWLIPVVFFAVIVLGLFALIGLWSGYPWLWAVLWGVVGTWWNTREYREKLVYDRIRIRSRPVRIRPPPGRRHLRRPHRYVRRRGRRWRRGGPRTLVHQLIHGVVGVIAAKGRRAPGPTA